MNRKKYIFIIFCIIIFIFCVASVIYKITGDNIFHIIVARKCYIKFDKLEKITIFYNPSNSPFEEYHTIKVYPEFKDIPACQVEVTDEKFLNLIEKNYKNKLLVDKGKDGMKVEGNFIINIDKDFQIYPKIYNECIVKYKDTFLEIEFNQEIYNEMIKIMINNLADK